MDQPDRSTSTAIWLCNSNHSSPTAFVPGWYMISLKTTTLSARVAGAATNRRMRSTASSPTPACSQGAWEPAGTNEVGERGTSVIDMSRHYHAGKVEGQSRNYGSSGKSVPEAVWE